MKIFLEGILDIFVSYALVFFLQHYYFPQVNINYLLISAFLSQLPDWLEIPYLLFNIKNQPFKFFYQVQHQIHHRLDLPWGLLPQIAIAFPLLLWSLI